MGKYNSNQREIKKIFFNSIIIGYNDNKKGKTVITTAIPTKLNTNEVSYSEIKTTPYKEYSLKIII